MATYYPPVSFHFSVEFSDVSDIEQRFQEVGGLSFEVETEELHAGGENQFSYKLPKRVKYPNLVLKRGLLQDKALIEWVEKAMEAYFTVSVDDFKPSNLIIKLLDEADKSVAQWNVVQAYPLKWAVSEFRATDNTIAVETIELAYHRFERIDPT